MKTDVEELSPTRVKLTIEVPFQELDHAFDETYKSLNKQVRIKGFRPGKAPARLIDRYVGRGAVVSEAVNHAVPELYNQAIQEKEVFALGQPDVEVTQLDDGEQLSFTAEVDVRPQFELPDYEGIEVTVDNVEVTEEQLEEQVATLQDRFATLTDAKRPAEHGDHLSIDLAAAVDGQQLEDVQASGLSYEIGTNTLLEGLDDALVGLSAGESTTFPTTLVGGEHEGRAADVTVTAHSVKTKELPDLDDEFAQMASEFDTMAELREDVRERLGQSRQHQQQSQARDRAMEKLIEAVEVPLPESVVSEEIDRRRQNLEQQLQRSGLTKESYLESQEQTEEEFDEELTESAHSAVKAGFVLDQLALKEEISADNNELSQYVIEQAQRMGVPPDQLIQHLRDSNQLRIAYTEVVRAKAIDLVVSKATVVDESGEPVSVADETDTEVEIDTAAEAELEAENTDADTESSAATEDTEEAAVEAATEDTSEDTSVEDADNARS